MFKLFKNLKKTECTLALLALIFIVLQVWLDLTMPEYMAEITSLVQMEGSTMGGDTFSRGKNADLRTGQPDGFCYNSSLCSKDRGSFRRNTAWKTVSQSTVIFHGRNRAFFYGKPCYQIDQ